MTGLFSCPCVFVSDSTLCARNRIVIRQGGILQSFEDIFKTLKILLVGTYSKMPCSAVGRAANTQLLFSRSWVRIPNSGFSPPNLFLSSFFLVSVFLKMLQIKLKRIFGVILHLHFPIT